MYNEKQERFFTSRVVRKNKRISSSEGLYKSYFDVVETINGLIVDFVSRRTGENKRGILEINGVLFLKQAPRKLFMQALADSYSFKDY